MGVLNTLHPSHFLRAIVITAAICNANASGRVHVNVWNQMREGSKLIKAECKSRDDDMGLQSLAIGKAYSWSFKPNFLGTTLFTCVVAAEYGCVGFKAYYFRREYDRCRSVCNWYSRVDGIHGFNDNTQSEDLFYPWVSG